MVDKKMKAPVAKEVPTGVKVIAVLNYIGAAIAAIVGILLLVGAGAAGSLADQIPGLAALGAAIFIVGGIVILAFAALGFFVGRGLWNAQPWARTVEIILAALGFLMAILGMVQGDIGGNVFGLVLNGVIGGYLLFNERVKAAFA